MPENNRDKDSSRKPGQNAPGQGGGMNPNTPGKTADQPGQGREGSKPAENRPANKDNKPAGGRNR